MKHLSITLVLLMLLSACSPSMDSPVTDNDPSIPNGDNILPREGDDALQRGTVYLDSIDLLVMESYPVQFSLSLSGNLPTPCSHLRVAVSPPDGQNQIMVDVYSLAEKDIFCAEVLQPFSQNIPLGSYPTGHYTLLLNGESITEFDA